MDILKKKIRVATTVSVDETDSLEPGVVMDGGPVASGPGFSLTEKISFVLFVASVFLLMVGFLPASFGVSVEVVKRISFISLTILSFFFFLLAKLEEGVVVLPKNKIIFAGFGVLLATGLSTIFSDSIFTSFSGLALDVDTFFFVVILFLSLFLSSIFFQDSGRAFYFYLTFAIGALLVFGVDILNMFFGFLPAGKIGNLIGKVNDMGVVWGLLLIISVLALETESLFSKLKKPLILLASVSVIGLIFVNFDLLWMLLAGVLLVLFVLSLFINGPFGYFSNADRIVSNKKSIIVRASFISLAVVVVCLLSVNTIGSLLVKLDLNQTEVRPSWSSTWEVAKSTLAESPVFGSGPNTFSGQWVKFKPADVNESIFWNTDFNVGVGRLPTYVVTVGGLGSVAWMIFLGMFVFYGIKSLFSPSVDELRKFFLSTSFVSALYLWIVSIIYVPDTVVFSFAFIFTGLMVGLMTGDDISKKYQFDFSLNPKAGFVSIVVIIFLIVGTVTSGYYSYKELAAIYNFQKGSYLVNTNGDVEGSIKRVATAVSFAPKDVYYRALSELYILSIRNLFSSKGLSQAELGTRFDSLLSSAVDSARKATEYNESNYLNWVSLGFIGESVVTLKTVEGAYDLALASYDKVAKLNPLSPISDLRLARLELANSNPRKAKIHLENSLAKKQNFTEALFLLSQIDADRGNIKEAIKKADQAVLFSPNETGLLFHQGFLKYLNKDYQGSVFALERAVSLNPKYSNARYFLGLSYSYLDQGKKALEQFREIQVLNPENEEIKKIISNLEDNVDPLKGIVPRPENKDKLPLDDK